MTPDDDDDALVDDPGIADLARAIADGTPVSWPSAGHSGAHAGVTHQLRTVQQIAALHRLVGDASDPRALTDGDGE